MCRSRSASTLSATGERIRDKIAASKKKGIWMGGNVPLGYEVRERKLLIVETEAERVRHIYRRYLEQNSVRDLTSDLKLNGIRSKSGGIISRGALYALLSNPICIGEIRHKDLRHPGQHEPILDRGLWEKVQQQLAALSLLCVAGLGHRQR